MTGYVKYCSKCTQVYYILQIFGVYPSPVSIENDSILLLMFSDKKKFQAGVNPVFDQVFLNR